MAKAKSRKRRDPRTIRVLGLAAAAVAAVALTVVLYILIGGRKGGSGDRYGGRGAGRAGAGTNGVQLFYSCGIEGRLAPFACEEGNLGGVARMATVYTGWAATHSYRLLVDAGSSTASRHETAETINAFTFSALDRLGYDVVNCGDNEATLSLEELLSLAKGRKFRLISANLVRADTQVPVFPTHHILRRRGVRIAVIGVLREDILPKHTGKGVRLISPAAALRGAINVAKDNADVIVVLAFLPPEEIYELARKHPEVHVFLGGLTPVTSAPVEFSGQKPNPHVIISYLGDQGCTVAAIDASFPKDTPPEAVGRVTLLDDSIPPDPAFSGIISEFTAALGGKTLPNATNDPKMPCTSSHVGSDVCKLCHIKQFYSWQGTPHAGAYVTLLEKGKQKDPACLTCHVTGYLMPGGFDPDKPADPAAALPKGPAPAAEPKGLPPEAKAKEVHPKGVSPRIALQGVGCECCHGGSRRHLGIAIRDRLAAARAPLLRQLPSREDCTRCHTPTRPCREPSVNDPYDPIEYMKRIKHWD